MRLIRNILIGVVVLIIAAGGVGMLLPRHIIVERELLIEAAPEAIYPHLNSLEAFSEWSPWSDLDPDMQVTYSGPETGAGNTMEWTSEDPSVGNGRQEIVEAVENESVRTALDFGEMGTAEAWWRLLPDGDGTRVVWGMDADMGAGPIGRWFGLMMDGWVGADYERGLASLQATVEG